MLTAFGEGTPDILLTTRSYQCRMTYQAAIELAFLCTAVESDPAVTFEVMQDVRFMGKTSNHVVIRKFAGTFSHYVLPMYKQDELRKWQEKLNME